MEEMEIERLSFGQSLFRIFLRLLAILAATIWISVLYKALTGIGVFTIIRRGGARRIIYCLAELFLLGLYWYYLYRFSFFCLRRTPTPAGYYLLTVIVFAAYAGIYWACYKLLSWDTFSTAFRITLNLVGVRFETKFPDNCLPYMFTYLGITFFVMLIEPLVEKIQFLRWQKMMDSQ